jgi:hypothetical protein
MNCQRPEAEAGREHAARPEAVDQGACGHLGKSIGPEKGGGKDSAFRQRQAEVPADPGKADRQGGAIHVIDHSANGEQHERGSLDPPDAPGSKEIGHGFGTGMD